MTVTPGYEAERLTGHGSSSNPTLRDLQRELGELLPNSAADETDSSTTALEVQSGVTEPPRLVSAVILEGTSMRQHRITDAPQASFAAVT